jgi:hypothetical protein
MEIAAIGDHVEALRQERQRTQSLLEELKVSHTEMTLTVGALPLLKLPHPLFFFAISFIWRSSVFSFCMESGFPFVWSRV